jgi:hypothetical protein
MKTRKERRKIIRGMKRRRWRRKRKIRRRGRRKTK